MVIIPDSVYIYCFSGTSIWQCLKHPPHFFILVVSKPYTVLGRSWLAKMIWQSWGNSVTGLLVFCLLPFMLSLFPKLCGTDRFTDVYLQTKHCHQQLLVFQHRRLMYFLQSYSLLICHGYCWKILYRARGRELCTLPNTLTHIEDISYELA